MLIAYCLMGYTTLAFTDFTFFKFFFLKYDPGAVVEDTSYGCFAETC